MSHHDHSVERSPEPRSFMSSRAGLVLVGFLVIAGALLFTEHRAHLFGFLPFLLLLACPLMHLFMHHGHGGHGQHRHGGEDERGSQTTDTKDSQKGNW